MNLIKIVICFVLFLSLIPFAVIVIAPFKLWQIIVIGIVKCFKSRQGFGPILTGLETLSAVGGIFETTKAQTINALMTLDGKIERAELRENLIRDILNANKPGKAELLYPKFKQFPENYMGYPFWKWSHDFCVDDHIKSWDQIVQNDSFAIHAVVGQLMHSVFPPGKPPWKIHIIPSNEGRSYVLVRIHHAICDGISLFQILVKSAANIEKSSDTFSTPRKNLQRTQKKWREIFKLPYSILHEYKNLSKKNCFNKHEPTKGHWLISSTSPFKLDDLKRAKLTLGFSSLTGILNSAIAGGIRTTIQNIWGDEYIPDKIYGEYIVPLPRDSRGAGLKNFYGFGVLGYHVGDPDLQSRLKKSEGEILKTFQSFYPSWAQFLITHLSSFPTCISACFMPVSRTMCLSNMPGPPTLSNIWGIPVSAMMFWIPTSISSINVTALSYNGAIQIGLSVDFNYIQEQGVIDELAQNIEGEIYSILKLAHAHEAHSRPSMY